MNRFDISNISKPLIVAPMAGGPSTLQLAAAACAVAAQLGTAFLLADEAGTHPTHRAALRDKAFVETIVTRAFTGRCARAWRNGFADRYGMQAPFGFPQIGFMTAPLQSAAGEADDAHGMALWAGTNFRQARKGSVAEMYREARRSHAENLGAGYRTRRHAVSRARSELTTGELMASVRTKGIRQ
jgi:nitronate monooxygenase